VGIFARRGDDGRPRALILVENAPVPDDRRVMGEARSLAANGFVVSVIAPLHRDQPREETIDGVLVRRYREYRIVSTWGTLSSQLGEYAVALAKTFGLMLRVARSPGFDVVQACNPPDLFFLIVWPFKLAGKRFIFDQHDLAPELYCALFDRCDGTILAALRWAERLSYRLADAVIACNESYRRVAISRGGLPTRAVFVVRNGPREGWPLQVELDERLKRGRPLLVVYTGVMGYQDGIDVLLEAIRTLVHDRGFHDATFALVGDGNAGQEMRRRARELSIADYVDFVGWVSDDEVLSRYLRTADACVCPETSSPLNDQSTFIKVMEYMAAGAPIVAFDLPETRVSAGDAAVYAPSGDIPRFAERLQDVLTDPELRARMKEEAARRIPELRWERQVGNLLAAYRYALARRGRRKAPTEGEG
jgi:glycosyltransferase involved in cell wall biosynthesis